MTSQAQWTTDAGTSITLWVTDEAALFGAIAVADRVLAETERAGRELRRIAERLPRGVRTSESLRSLIVLGLARAAETHGAYAPTVPQYGPDRGLVALRDARMGGARVRVVTDAHPWGRIVLDDDHVQVPAGVVLDLDGLGRAAAADRAARGIARELGCGVLISVGGAVATAGEATEDGWQVAARGVPQDSGVQVTLGAGGALATASTRRTRWVASTRAAARLADPRTLAPRVVQWDSVSVADTLASRAYALAEAALEQGPDAIEWLAARGAEARLVAVDGTVVTTSGWPAEAGTAA